MSGIKTYVAVMRMPQHTAADYADLGITSSRILIMAATSDRTAFERFCANLGYAQRTDIAVVDATTVSIQHEIATESPGVVFVMRGDGAPHPEDAVAQIGRL